MPKHGRDGLGLHLAVFQLNMSLGNSKTAHQENWQGAQQGAMAHSPDTPFLLELNPALPKEPPWGL